MKQILKFMAFFVASALAIPLITVYFGRVFGYIVTIFASLM